MRGEEKRGSERGNKGAGRGWKGECGWERESVGGRGREKSEAIETAAAAASHFVTL